jgi:purine-binding chemotaxis protein CheW
MEKSTKANKEEIQEALFPYIVFKLGNEDFAIRIEQIKEVTLANDITRMPNTPPFIVGVANVRGNIIAIMDLEKRFKMKKRGDKKAEKNYILVIERGNYHLGLLVKEVPQTINLGASHIDNSSPIVKELTINEKYIKGIGKINSRLIIILDVAKIITIEEEKQLIKEV